MKIGIASSLCLIVMASGLMLPVWAQKQLTPLTIEDALATRIFPGLVRPSISADGRLVAYTLEEISPTEGKWGLNTL